MSRAKSKTTPRPHATKAQGRITPSKPDPMFALIEKHRAAEAAFCRAVDVFNKITIVFFNYKFCETV